MHRRVRLGLCGVAVVAIIVAIVAINRRSSSAHGDAVASTKRQAEHRERRASRLTAASPEDDQLKAELYGRVFAKGGRAIAGAEVCAGQEELASCATTGADGRYAIEALAPGRWSLHASKQGYLTAKPEPEGTRGEIDLGAGASEAADFVLLEGGARLLGFVRDSGGGVIAGATIEEDNGARATSDDEGRFLLWLTPGIASFTVRAEGYAPELANGSVPGEVDVVLHPASTISGRVVASGSSKPIAGARVITEWSGGDIDAISDEHGQFTLLEVPPGEHRLSATAPGWFAEHGDTIVVGRADSVRDVVLEATAAFSIRGAIVRLPDRETCSRGQVYVWSVDGTLDDEFHADSEGRYEVHGLPPGTYEVTANCERGDTGSTVDVEIKDADVEQEFEIEAVAARLRGIVVGRGDQPRGNVSLQIQHKESYATLMLFAGADGRFEVLLPQLGTWKVMGTHNCPEDEAIVELDILVPDPPPATISLGGMGGIRGRTVDEDGNPLSTELIFVPSGTTNAGGCIAPNVTSSGKDGRFEVDLAPERWLVRGGDRAEDGEPLAVRTKGGEVEMIDVEAAEVAEVEIVFEAHRGKISGRVVDRDGHPVPDAMVSASHVGVEDEDVELEGSLLYDELDFEYGFQVTDEDGRFTIKDIAEGIYGVGAKARQGGCGKVYPVRTGTEITIKLDAWTSIEGTAVAASGGPATLYTLTASSADDYRRINVRSADGKFALRSLAPGRYELYADSREGEGRKIIEARAGESIKNVELLMSPKARVRGRIVGDDGEPVINATVQVARMGGEDEDHAFDPAAVTTDEQGRFDITGAPLGGVWLMVSEPDHYIPMTELVLRSGEVLEVEVEANRFGREYELHPFEGD